MQFSDIDFAPNGEEGWDNLIAEHREWLKAQPSNWHLKSWNDLLAAHEHSAIQEATVRRYLQREGIRVEANAIKNQLAPDFRCVAMNGKKFYVEATYIQSDKVAEKSEVPDNHTGATHYLLLTQRLSCVTKNKHEQCRNLDAPVLVAVGAFHSHTSLLMGRNKIAQLLTGKTMTGARTVFTRKWAAFFSETGDLTYREISGLLFFCSTSNHPVKYGILHPCPIHAFDPTLLPEVTFGSVDRNGTSVTWSKEDDYYDMGDDELFASFREAGISEEDIEHYRQNGGFPN